MSPYLKIAEIKAFKKINIKKNVIDLNGLSYFIPSSYRHKLWRNWGVVTEADVDVILDASGFAYGDQWSTVILRQAAIEVKRMKRKKKHYVFMPQALGPFSDKKSQSAAKLAFESASVVFAREQESLEHALACAPNANIHKAPDFTNLLTVEPKDAYTKYKGGVAFILNSKMISSKNKNTQWRERYIILINMMITSFVEKGEKVFLLNHEGESDQVICDEVNEAFECSIDIVSPDSSLDVKAIIGNAKVVVCSRYHGCVSALSQGVPCIGTSWSHKYEKLFAEYNTKELMMTSNLKQEQIKTMTSHIIADHKIISEKLTEYSIKYKKESEGMWSELNHIIQC
jgi:colanic acid/amylovoran biosynthesis protein